MEQKYLERKSNISIWGVPVFLGIAIMVVTFGLTFYYKNNLVEIYRNANPLLPHPKWEMEIGIVTREIEGNKIVIGSEKSLLEMENIFPKSPEESNKIVQKRTDRIKRLEDKNVELLIKRDELEKKKQESIGQPTGILIEDYNLDGLTLVLCLGIIASVLAFVTFVDKFKPIKGNGLTVFERKADSFFLMSVFLSLFGFFLFMWYVSIT